MEIYQIVLMVIGAITLVWLSYKVLKGFIWCLDAGLASCFREKYPYDFEMKWKYASVHLCFQTKDIASLLPITITIQPLSCKIRHLMITINY